jgi:hypothetical protein
MSLFLALLLVAAPAAYAQDAQLAQQESASQEAPKPTLQERLMPANAAALIAPVAPEETRMTAVESDVAHTIAQSRGTGTGLIIAGGALFVAGLLVGDDAGTVLAVAGAAIGAYGLYLYFG